MLLVKEASLRATNTQKKFARNKHSKHLKGASAKTNLQTILSGNKKWTTLTRKIANIENNLSNSAKKLQELIFGRCVYKFELKKFESVLSPSFR